MDVQFNETSYAPRAVQAPRSSAITKLVMKAGLAKDEKQATMALLWIIGLCVAVMLGLWLVPALMPEPEVEPVVLPR